METWENRTTLRQAGQVGRFLSCNQRRPAETLQRQVSQCREAEPRSAMVRIPVLGSIIAGMPRYAEQNIIDWGEISEDMCKNRDEFFALKVKGKYMAPRIEEGDVLIIRAQDYIEDGEIGIVMINGDEATVKVVREVSNGIMLIGYNTAVYAPTFYSRQEIEVLPIWVIGKVVFMRREF